MFVGKDFTPAKIDEVQKESPAEVAGLKKMTLFYLLMIIKLKAYLDVSCLLIAMSLQKNKYKVLRNQK